MAKHRTHSTVLKRQVAQEYLAGETLYGLSKRRDLSRNLIRIWVETYHAGVLDEDAVAADLLQSYEARIAALERPVGKQALELEFLKTGTSPRTRTQPSATTPPFAFHGDIAMFHMVTIAGLDDFLPPESAITITEAQSTAPHPHSSDTGRPGRSITATWRQNPQPSHASSPDRPPDHSPQCG